MQVINHAPKILLFILLSLSLLFIWYGNQTGFTGVGPNVTDEQPAEDSIWSSMADDFALDHKAESPQVQAEIRIFIAEKEKLYATLKAAEPYIYYIYNQTKSRGVPAELALIPAIESEFNPYDRSVQGATGLWQLEAPTARDLGIKVTSNYDGRRNVIASTKASLAYFKDLGKMFKNDWYLAIGAYDCGQGKVMGAERRKNSHVFWNLMLPQETEQYVAKLLAISAIVKNPEKYGIELPQVSNKPYFTPLAVNKPVKLKEVAQSSDINLVTLNALNPDYTLHPPGKTELNPKDADINEAKMLLVPVEKAVSVITTFADNFTPLEGSVNVSQVR